MWVEIHKLSPILITMQDFRHNRNLPVIIRSHKTIVALLKKKEKEEENKEEEEEQKEEEEKKQQEKFKKENKW